MLISLNETAETTEEPYENWVIFAVTDTGSVKILAGTNSAHSFQDDVDGWTTYAEDGCFYTTEFNGKVFKSIWENDFSTDYFGESDGGWYPSMDEKYCVEIFNFLTLCRIEIDGFNMGTSNEIRQ